MASQATALLSSVLSTRSSGELRLEAVKRHCLDHAVGRNIHPGEQGCDRNRPIGHGHAIGDVLRHFDGRGVIPRKQLLAGEIERLAADPDGQRRLCRLIASSALTTGRCREKPAALLSLSFRRPGQISDPLPTRMRRVA